MLKTKRGELQNLTWAWTEFQCPSSPVQGSLCFQELANGFWIRHPSYQQATSPQATWIRCSMAHGPDGSDLNGPAKEETWKYQNLIKTTACILSILEWNGQRVIWLDGHQEDTPTASLTSNKNQEWAFGHQAWPRRGLASQHWTTGRCTKKDQNLAFAFPTSNWWHDFNWTSI